MVLSYRHAFHAGNFADVVKHTAQCLMLSHFHRKPRPFYFLDTHAGGALYNLKTSMEAAKTMEYQAGIGRLWHRKDYPREMEPYLSALRNLNGLYPLAGGQKSSSISYASERGTPPSQQIAGLTPLADRARREYAWHHLLHSTGVPTNTSELPSYADSYPDEAFHPDRLEFYPGSSLLAAYFQRQVPIRATGRTIFESVRDRMVSCELHPTEFEGLRAFMEARKHDPNSGEPRHLLSYATRDRIHVVRESGFAGLRSSNNNVFLAPKQGRGLVLVDPPYEVESEAEELLRSLPKALQRFPHGLYALWYPIIDYSPGSPKKLDVTLFKTLIKQMNIPKTLCVEFDMQDTIRATRTGLTPEASAESSRALPLLDESASPMGTSKFSDRERGLGMTGTGLILINPPYQFDTHMRNVCEWLSTAMPVPVQVQGQEQPQLYPAKFEVTWLTGEAMPRAQRLALAAAEAQAAAENAANNTPLDIDAPLDTSLPETGTTAVETPVAAAAPPKKKKRTSTTPPPPTHTPAPAAPEEPATTAAPQEYRLPTLD